MTRTPRAAAVELISLSLSFLLIVSLCSPFALRKAAAAAKMSASKKTTASAPPPSGPLSRAINQSARRREGELIVRFRDGATEQEKSSIVEARGAHRSRRLRGESGVERLATQSGQDVNALADELRQRPEVEFVEPNFLVSRDQREVSDPRFAEQWALKNTGQEGGTVGSDINAASAWRETTGTRTTVIAIVDSGVDFTHPDLKHNEWINDAEKANNKDEDHDGFVDDTNGWDWVAVSNNIHDEGGHGTAVAGIIAAQGNNGVGTTGVMWRASLMSLRVLDSTGAGDVASAVEAIDYAVAHGAQVINCSWGTDAESLALKDAIKRAGRHGVVVVTSAGNAARDIDLTPYYPASFNLPNLITVASTDHFDNLASFSDYGPSRVAVAAPGTDILTTKMGGDYWTVTGTSASAPLVAGVAGLIKTLRPNMTPAAVREAITSGARRVATLDGKVSSGGVVDAASALRSLRANPYGGVNNGGNGNGGNGNGGNGNGRSDVPPALRHDNDDKRARGKKGVSVTPPTALQGAPGGHLPNLDESRKRRTSPVTSPSSQTIQSNFDPLQCADCDPGAGGGAGGNDPYFGTARTRTINEVGEPGVTLGSRNFNWSLPLLSLPQRGDLDLSVVLYYNSLVWTRQDTTQGSIVEYNADHGTPAPGFELGMPRIQPSYYDSDTGATGYLMITPSGGRVEMSPLGNSNVYESIDGSHTQFIPYGSGGIATTTDGTHYYFVVMVGGEMRCTGIKDRNGNYMNVAYDTETGHLTSVADTLGRIVNFNHDPTSGNLTNITQTWGGVTHTYATFVYAPLSMSVNFPGLTPIGLPPSGSSQTVLSYVALTDNESYHFDYNSYGQVYQIRHKAPDGHELEHTRYNLSDSDLTGAQTDCPRFTAQYDYAQDWNNGQEAMTSYAVYPSSTWTHPSNNSQQTGTMVQQTTPDGTIYREYSLDTGWAAGLPQRSEIVSGGVVKKWVGYAWTQDDPTLGYAKNARIFQTDIGDAEGNRRQTKIFYHTTSGISLPESVEEWGGTSAGLFLLRRTVTAYKWDADYINRRIIGLPYERLVYEGSTGNIVSRAIYHYDWGAPYFTAQAPAAQYDAANYPSSFIVGRGNLVVIVRYNCTNNTTAYDDNQAQWVRQNGYDMAGNTVWAKDGAGHTTNISYADNFSDAASRPQTYAYPTQVTDPDGNLSTTQYNYDFGAVTRTHAPTSGTGAGTTYVDEVIGYDGVGRLTQVTNQTNGAYKRWVYNPAAFYVQSFETIKDTTQASEFYSWQVMDGAGRVRATAQDHPGSSGGYSAQLTVYDNMGRAVQQYKPTEINGDWAPTGDDSTWVMTTQGYDWKGRPLQTTNADGTTRSISYGGCGCAGGEVTTTTDEHGRQKRLTKDPLGRLKQVEELNWNATVYAATTYAYNARDQITQINEAGQTRTLQYDGYGRLSARTTPEQGTTGYTYNADDTPNVVTDARGATQTFGYNNNRQLVSSINYGVPSGVAATPNVSFAYDAAGHRTQMTDGQGSTTYNYNSLGQLSYEERTFTNAGTYRLSYDYNVGGELKSITNPWNRVISYSYDKAGRVTSVDGANYLSAADHYANSITYRAFGSVKGMSYANGRTLSTSYDARMRATSWDVSGVLGYTYNYDYMNERTGRVSFAQSHNDATLDRSFEYDHVGRLVISHSGAEARAAIGQGTWGVGDGPYSQGYDYDVWGNLTHRYGWGGEVQNTAPDLYYTYTNNRRNGFTYDASGNLTFDGGQHFTYDAVGQQATSDYTNLQNFYDGDGLRVKRTEDNLNPALFLRSTVLGGQVVAEIDYVNGVWSWWRGYVYLGSQLLAYQAGGVYFVHEDAVTKSKRVTDMSGVIESWVESDPWGADTSRSSNGAFLPQKYTSYERDANGSDEAMARRYNRWHSRFDQPDPYEGSYDLSDPQSFNRYAYVGNDPVNFTDPTGLDDNYLCYNGTCWPDGMGTVTVVPDGNLGMGGGTGYFSTFSTGFPIYDLGIDAIDRVGGSGPSNPPRTDGSTRAVNAAIGTCGTVASIGQYSTVYDGMWRGRNGVMYPMRWGGNGATGARSAAVGRAGALGLLSRTMGTIGAGFSFYQGAQSYRQGNNTGAAKSGLDGAMSLVGAFGGPAGAVASGGYFVMDTVGWEKLLPTQRDIDRPSCQFLIKHGK